VLVACAFEAKEDGYHHHTNAQPKATPHHRLPPSSPVDEEGGKEAADDKHDLDASSKNQREIPGETYVFLKDRWNEVSVSKLDANLRNVLMKTNTTRLMPPT
jgi:hypothetical protein